MEMGNGPEEVHLSTVLKIYNDNQDLVQRLVRVSPMIYGNFIVNILPISQEIFDVTTIQTKVGALIYHRLECLKLQSIFL